MPAGAAAACVDLPLRAGEPPGARGRRARRRPRGLRGRARFARYRADRRTGNEARIEVIEAAGDIRDQLPPEYASLVSEPMRIVCAPMYAAGRGVGVIMGERSLNEPPLDASERHLLWTLGKAAALASVARSVATQAETSRQLRQRIDLAREVHEGVIQRLFGVSMVLDGEGTCRRRYAHAARVRHRRRLTELREAMQRPLGRAARVRPGQRSPMSSRDWTDTQPGSDVRHRAASARCRRRSSRSPRASWPRRCATSASTPSRARW